MRCIVRPKFLFFGWGTLSFLTNIDFEKYSHKLILCVVSVWVFYLECFLDLFLVVLHI